MLKTIVAILGLFTLSVYAVVPMDYNTTEWTRIDAGRIAVVAPSMSSNSQPTLTLDIVNNGLGKSGMAISYFDKANIKTCTPVMGPDKTIRSQPVGQNKTQDIQVNGNAITFRSVCNVDEGIVWTPANLSEATRLVDLLYSASALSMDNAVFTTNGFPAQAEALVSIAP